MNIKVEKLRWSEKVITRSPWTDFLYNLFFHCISLKVKWRGLNLQNSLLFQTKDLGLWFIFPFVKWRTLFPDAVNSIGKLDLKKDTHTTTNNNKNHETFRAASASALHATYYKKEFLLHFYRKDFYVYSLYLQRFLFQCSVNWMVIHYKSWQTYKYTQK